MDKDRIQQVADRIAQERFYTEFYHLPKLLQVNLYSEAEKEVMEQNAGMADAEREGRK